MEDQDFEETEKQSSGKLGWILETGFNLGKKFVITSVVISSAPIVLPPLIVVSALGFACSVPFGFVFASYACTQKLMSKLLLPPPPPPPPPPQYQLIDDYVTYSSNEVDEEEAKDEEELRDEIENAGLVENREKQDLGRSWEQITDDNKVGNGYEELNVVGESVLGKDNEEDELNKEELKPFVGEEIEVGGDVMAKDDSIVATQNKEDDDGKIKSEEIGDVQETEPLLIAQNLDLNKGKSNVNNSNNENVEKLVFPEKKGKGKEKKRQNNSKGKDRTTTSMVIDKNKKRQEGDKRVHEKETKKSSIENNSKSSQVKKAKLEVGGFHVPEANATTDDISKSSTEKSQSSKLEERVLPSGMNEAGNLDISYEPIDKNVGSKGQNIEDDVVYDVYYEKQDENKKCVDVLAIETTKEYHREEGTVIEDTKYSLEVTDLRDLPELERHGDVKDLPELKHHEEKPELKVDVKNVRPDEGLISDEKIWKQIDAIRLIVGFSAPRNTSYFEELKALYLFTGIEPPSLLMGSSDLPEFYSKLCFLMSVIGVK